MNAEELENLVMTANENPKASGKVVSELRKGGLIYLAHLLSEKNTSPEMAATITELIMYFKI